MLLAGCCPRARMLLIYHILARCFALFACEQVACCAAPALALGASPGIASCQCPARGCLPHGVSAQVLRALLADALHRALSCLAAAAAAAHERCKSAPGGGEGAGRETKGHGPPGGQCTDQGAGHARHIRVGAARCRRGGRWQGTHMPVGMAELMTTWCSQPFCSSSTVSPPLPSPTQLTCASSHAALLQQLGEDRPFLEILPDVIKSYGMSLQHGSEHSSQSLPRMLTLWFEFGTYLHTFRKGQASATSPVWTRQVWLRHSISNCMAAVWFHGQGATALRGASSC